MARKLRRVARHAETPAYPSLHEHVASRREQAPSRRRFLGVAGATLAVGGLAACSRNMGIDAEPDASIEIGGAEPQPDYFTIRFPLQGDLTAWLSDGGYATFWLTAVTWNEQSYQTLLDQRADAEAQLRATLSDFTYDGLNSAQGESSAEDDLLDALDQFCQEQNHHNDPTIQTVNLTITYLTPNDDLMGDMAEPAYPE